MARSLFSAVITTTFLANGVTLLLKRRGYAVAAALGNRGGALASEKTVREHNSGSANSSASNSWIPDPVTGYYRPANGQTEVDTAELRKTLLSHKN